MLCSVLHLRARESGGKRQRHGKLRGRVSLGGGAVVRSNEGENPAACLKLKDEFWLLKKKNLENQVPSIIWEGPRREEGRVVSLSRPTSPIGKLEKLA